MPWGNREAIGLLQEIDKASNASERRRRKSVKFDPKIGKLG